MHDFTPNPKGSRPNREALHEGSSGNVIQLHETKQAKAQGIFAQINIAASRLGYSPTTALRAAQDARDLYLQGGSSAARVVSKARAGLRQRAELVTA